MSFLQQLRDASPELVMPTENPPPAGKPVHIHSYILDTDLWIIPDGWTGELDGPVYTDSEIRELDRLQPSPDELRQIHTAKVHLDGVLEPDAHSYPLE
jgi:hypothetical protein